MNVRLIIGIAFLFLILNPTMSYGQTIPPNSTASPYSLGGWKCDSGYKKTGNTCVEINVPQNASLSPYDYIDGWKCDFGYLKAGKSCDKIELPENASLNRYDVSTGWKCNPGYKKSGSTCQKINIPQNASLSPYDYIDGWKCDFGYLKTGKSCDKIEVPENASLNRYDRITGWKCNPYYKKAGSKCLAMNDAERLKFDLFNAQLEQAVKSRKARSLASQHCDTEPDTDSEVCVRVVDAEIECSENYEETYYDSCEVEIDYIVETDYSGNGSIEVEVRCDVEVEYESETSYSGSEDEDFTANVTLYADDSHSGNEDVDFSLYYEEPTSVKVTEASCKIYDLSR